MSEATGVRPDLFRHWFWILLVVGVLVRCVNLDQPILDAHPTRQTQTADAVRGMIVEPGFQVSAMASWRGDLEARIVQELPLYNWMVEGVWRVWTLAVGGDAWPDQALNWAEIRRLDSAGRLVSIALWVAGFWVLQAVWRRLLQPAEAVVANLFFVFSPLSVFFGQAFMPEMLIQLLALVFVVLCFRYTELPEAPRFRRWGVLGGMTLVAALGMTVKAPEFTHYGVFLVLLLALRGGWRAVWLRPEHYLAGLVVLGAVWAWGQTISRINAAHFAEWSSSDNLQMFLGTLEQRFSPRFYVKVGAYVGFLLATPVGLFLAGSGVIRLLGNRRDDRMAVLGFWGISVLVFYAVWGPRTAGGHSYYNLPALAPLAALAGVGAVGLWHLAASRDWARRWRPWVAAALAVGFAAVAVTGMVYQSGYDRVVESAARWTAQKTPPGSHILVKLNHEPLGVDHPHQPLFSYYACRPTWIWTKVMPPEERSRAMEQAAFVIETMPVPYSPLRKLAIRLGASDARNREDISAMLAALHAEEVHRETGFVVYRVVR